MDMPDRDTLASLGRRGMALDLDLHAHASRGSGEATRPTSLQEPARRRDRTASVAGDEDPPTWTRLLADAHGSSTTRRSGERRVPASPSSSSRATTNVFKLDTELPELAVVNDRFVLRHLLPLDNHTRALLAARTEQERTQAVRGRPCLHSPRWPCRTPRGLQGRHAFRRRRPRVPIPQRERATPRRAARSSTAWVVCPTPRRSRSRATCTWSSAASQRDPRQPGPAAPCWRRVRRVRLPRSERLSESRREPRFSGTSTRCRCLACTRRHSRLLAPVLRLEAECGHGRTRVACRIAGGLERPSRDRSCCPRRTHSRALHCRGREHVGRVRPRKRGACRTCEPSGRPETATLPTSPLSRRSFTAATCTCCQSAEMLREQSGVEPPVAIMRY